MFLCSKPAPNQEGMRESLNDLRHDDVITKDYIMINSFRGEADLMNAALYLVHYLFQVPLQVYDYVHVYV